MVSISTLKKHGLMLVVGVAMIALLTFALVINYNKSAEIIVLPVVKNCPLQTKPCTTTLPNGDQLTFEISPKDPKAMDTLDLDVKLSSGQAESVRIKLNGKTMNMGFLEYDLKAATTENKNHFSGKGGFSVCIIGKMEWIVTVSIFMNNTLYDVPFEMDTFYYGG